MSTPLLTQHDWSAHTDIEIPDVTLDAVVTLARRRDARSVAIGSGRSLADRMAAATLTGSWADGGGRVVEVVDWPDTAASWLRQARRITAADTDMWILLGSAPGWAQMVRRLLWSTTWRPERTVAIADLDALAAVGVHNLDGLTGFTPDGRAWAVADGAIVPGQNLSVFESHTFPPPSVF